MERTIKVMSFNIRNDSDRGAESWEARLPRLAALLRVENPDLMGLQEVTNRQYKDMVSAFPEYSHAGAGRNDGRDSGERAAVFYKTKRFEALETKNFWISKTPQIPSMGWDAACIRICTYVKLRDKKCGGEFYFFNTHLDHVGKRAMLEGAKLLRRKMLEKSAPAFVTGDFNTGENTPPYEVMTENGLADAKFTAGQTMTYGSFHGYNPTDGLKDESPIDYIFHTPEFETSSYRVLVNGEKGAFTSDHYPVAAELSLKC